MSDEYTHDCSTCSSNCGSRKQEDTHAKPHDLSHIKKVIGIVSGKGGVGKSLVTGLLALMTSRRGKQCAILDADITGASVPKMFGIHGGVDGDDSGIYPRTSESGIRVISSNLLLPNETEPIIWRGPVISGMVSQFWTDVIWGDVDYMFVDMPPGTGDVPLTVYQSIKLDGIVIVTSPQELVSMIVAKAVKMANMMNIPIIGVVENMSYVKCPHCGEEFSIFGTSKVDEVATEFELKVLARVPFDPEIAKACDNGKIEEVNTDCMNFAVDTIL